jgi:hypothetical protein
MPASAGSIRAGVAYLEASQKDDKQRAALKAAEARLKSFGRRVRAIGAKLGAG